jgi:hypothetical protein
VWKYFYQLLALITGFFVAFCFAIEGIYRLTEWATGDPFSFWKLPAVIVVLFAGIGVVAKPVMNIIDKMCKETKQ